MAEDLEPDALPGADLGKRDVGPDSAGTLETGTTETPVRDVAEDQRLPVETGPTEPVSPGDAKNDLGNDKGGEPVPEPGVEPGAEPGKEPGVEPGAEPGAEPGPEPGKEPGAEPPAEPPVEPPTDGGTDALNDCTFMGMGSGAAQGSHSLNTTSAVCLFTCDTVQGWNVSNFDGRTVAVNGGAPATIAGGVNQPGLTKVNGYNVWKISAGSKSFASMSWWGSSGGTCSPPAGGF